MMWRVALRPLSCKIYDLAEAKIMILLSPPPGGRLELAASVNSPSTRARLKQAGASSSPSPPRWGRKEFLMFSQGLSIRNSKRGGPTPPSASSMLRPRNTPQSPRRPPDEPALQHLRHRIIPPGAARPAAHEPKQRHERPLPEPMPGDCLIAIFRTGRRMAAGLADEGGERELIGADQRKAEKPAGRLRERALPVAGAGMMVVVSTHRKARHESSPPLWGR
jgi:hypothetical protein